MSTWLTVPIRGGEPPRPTLLPLIQSSGIAADRTVVVVTGYAGTTLFPFSYPHSIIDNDPPNIHRWWNRGIEWSEVNGADIVIVTNDDVICHEPMTLLSDALRQSGATLAYPSTGPGGWCYALNLAHGVRPDEAFSWWYGDNDLWRRAADAHGVIKVKCNIEHLKRDYTDLNEWQRPLVEADRKLYTERYPDATDI